MADVTISQLTQGTPAGNNILPYSNGQNTLGVPVSAIFQSVAPIGINGSGVVQTAEGGGPITLSLYNSNITDPVNGLGSTLQLRNTNNTDLSKNTILFAACDTGGSFRHGAAIVSGKESNWIGDSGNYPGYLSFWTRDSSIGQSEKMRISSKGITTKPFQPAFAVRANAQTLSQSDPNSPYPKISLTNEIFNIGNYWNSSSSQFVAPVAGVYSFSGMIRLNTFPGSYFYPTISINGTQYIDKYAVAGNGPLPGLVWTGGLQQSFVTTNWQQLIKLDAGDVIALNFRAYSNGTYQIDSQTVFYGYLLG
jgi:hypothetical protein